ncbi:hypothetical protein QBC47DRAFT_2776 [Echria macrotheca]|uniref:Uncharacterized protein n=1 Tax=Echria macrotheca TaxID=438768 RepID=A0AAJ0BQL6_9PEZI|nr:hypothetical protein QBC47DRAFT_2776 [Echria macrotheca]
MSDVGRPAEIRCSTHLTLRSSSGSEKRFKLLTLQQREQLRTHATIENRGGMLHTARSSPLLSRCLMQRLSSPQDRASHYHAVYSRVGASLRIDQAISSEAVSHGLFCAGLCSSATGVVPSPRMYSVRFVSKSNKVILGYRRYLLVTSPQKAYPTLPTFPTHLRIARTTPTSPHPSAAAVDSSCGYTLGIFPVPLCSPVLTASAAAYDDWG